MDLLLKCHCWVPLLVTHAAVVGWWVYPAGLCPPYPSPIVQQ
jgi:hypothetical protein